MKAFIVYTPDIKEMAEECRDRVLRFTNIKEVEMLSTSLKGGHKISPYSMKLRAWQAFKEPMWLVDADLWFLQPCVLPEPRGPVIFGNPDNSPLVKEKYKLFPIENGHAINTSLVGADCSDPKFQEAVKLAATWQRQDHMGEAPYDEFYFNAVMHQRELVIARLSTRFNWCGDNPPARTIAVHAASQSNKLEWLRGAVKNYERNSTAPDA